MKDLKHLETLVEPDLVVSGMFQRLATRDKTSLAFILGGLAVGTVFVILAKTIFRSEDCSGFGGCQRVTSDTLFGAGLAIGSVVPILGLGIQPGKADLLDVITLWNLRHTDRPLKLAPEAD